MDQASLVELAAIRKRVFGSEQPTKDVGQIDFDEDPLEEDPVLRQHMEAARRRLRRQEIERNSVRKIEALRIDYLTLMQGCGAAYRELDASLDKERGTLALLHSILKDVHDIPIGVRTGYKPLPANLRANMELRCVFTKLEERVCGATSEAMTAVVLHKEQSAALRCLHRKLQIVVGGIFKASRALDVSCMKYREMLLSTVPIIDRERIARAHMQNMVSGGGAARTAEQPEAVADQAELTTILEQTSEAPDTLDSPPQRENIAEATQRENIAEATQEDA
jgi:hypothetical protein